MHGVIIPSSEGSVNPQVLNPFDAKEVICLKEAAARAGKKDTTIRNWCRDHHVGRQVGGGAWMVSQVALGDVPGRR
jgi:hypothetical protein